MKRLLHRSSKKSDESQSPAPSPRRPWSGTGGLGAQLSRERSGSHPQIRHLAMEGHAGPVTRATMDEIRRDAAASSSNLRINSLALAPAAPSASASASVPPQAAGLRDAPAEFPPRTSSAAFAGPPLSARPSRQPPDPPKPHAPGSCSHDSDALFSASGPDASAARPPAPRPPERPDSPSASEASRRVISDKIKHLASRFSNPNLKDQPAPPPQVVRRRPSNSPSVSERVSLFDGYDHPRSADPRSEIFGRFGMASAQSGRSRASSASGIDSLPASSAPHTPTQQRRPLSMALPDAAAAAASKCDSEKPQASDCDSDPYLSDAREDIPAAARLNFPSSGSYRGVRNSSSSSRRRRHRASVHSSFGSTADMLRINTSPADSSAPAHPPLSPRVHTSADVASSYASSAATSPSGTHSRFRRAGSVLAQPGSSTADIQRSSSTASHALGVRSLSRNRSLSATNSPVPSASSTDHALREGNGTNNNAAAADSENQMLWSCLAPRLHISGDNADIDSVLAAAVNSDLSANSFEQPLQGAEAAAQLVDTVVATLETDKVLPSLEYDKYLLEAALLKPRVQSLRVQLAAQLRKRDEAKSLVDGHKPSSLGMFKGKSAQQALDYSDASAAVAETEVKLSELSTKLHYIESALRDHQVGVLLSALKTTVAESAHLQRSNRTHIAALELRVEKLDSEATSSHSAHAAKLEALAAKHAAETAALEEEIRSLKNKHHDAVARQVSRSAEHADVDASLAQHSASLAVERLNGELTVLKEQKRDAEQQIRILESRLDDALLEAQDARNSLASVRSQAESNAQDSAARLDACQNKIESQHMCLQAMSTGLKSVVASLRSLDDVHASSEKLRALNSDPAVLASTPPATPTLAAADGSTPSPAAIEEACEALLNEEGLNADNRVAWKPEQITSALSLLTLTLDECSKLHSQAMKLHNAHMQLRKDLGAEQRLREAQGLAISQQREKLARANYLAESADQRVKEATDMLVAKHAEERARWNEETQRLLDNTERLKQDLIELQAANATMAPMRSVASAEAALEQPTVGSIEPVEATAAIADMSSQVKELELRLQECQSEVQAVRAQLQASVSENSRLEAQVLQLQHVEADLHLQLSELKTVQVSHDSLVRELEAAKAKSRASVVKRSANNGLLLGDYMRKHKDSDSVLSSADVTAVDDPAQARNAKPDGSSTTSSRPTRRWSLMDLRQAADLQANGRIRHSLNLDAATATEFASTDVQTMTDMRPAASLEDENVAQMLAAYSEKLMLKEDALRGREEDLEAVRAAAEEIEKALNKIVQPGIAAPAHNSFHALPRASLASVSSAAGNGSWSNGISAKTKPTLRNRSASFFHGLRSSSYRISGGSSPDIPAAMFPARSESLSRSNSPLPQHTDRPSSASADHVVVLARSESQTTSSIRTISRSRSDVNNVPAFVRSLLPLVQTAVSEADRLRNLIGDLESQSHEAHAELIDTRKKLAQLQNHCHVREKQEDAVQQDIAHVLGQISRLREHVVHLEREKSAFEDEAQMLRKRCREIEDRTSEQVLQLIVNRVGKREWEKQRAVKTDLNAVAEASVATPASSPDTDPKLPARFASISAVEVSHPEASDIRSEFNELLHRIISRRDEDIDRIQALADAWRSDARKASHASELHAWNTSSRGTQTA
ncbi:hypothetical protein EV183_003716 [Coemansia sp. RSA 2336]|nr:hypothetical protein EV183_003716 [Coemansia sp. RSA 2336]